MYCHVIRINLFSSKKREKNGKEKAWNFLVGTTEFSARVFSALKEFEKKCWLQNYKFLDFIVA